MSQRYRAVYRDAHGEETTEIVNDGTTLTMTVRGVELRGQSLDDFEPSGNAEAFTLNRGQLCSCELEIRIPIAVDGGAGGRCDSTLAATLELGEPAPNGGIDREILSLSVQIGDVVYRSQGLTGWFEDEMLDLQDRLPAGAHFRSCISCALSDYSPYGHGLFGTLACFRGVKDAYRRVASKTDLFDLWDSMTEYVQETHVCPEFERRGSDTGYRG